MGYHGRGPRCPSASPPINCQICTTLFRRLNVQCRLKRNDDDQKKVVNFFGEKVHHRRRNPGYAYEKGPPPYTLVWGPRMVNPAPMERAVWKKTDDNNDDDDDDDAYNDTGMFELKESLQSTAGWSNIVSVAGQSRYRVGVLMHSLLVMAARSGAWSSTWIDCIMYRYWTHCSATHRHAITVSNVTMHELRPRHAIFFQRIYMDGPYASGGYVT